MKNIPQKFLILILSLTLSFTTIACGGSTNNTVQNPPNVTNNTPQSPSLGGGKYPVQQASYDDVNGEYTLMLLNANPPLYRSTELQMARLTDEQLKNGEKTYLELDGQNAVLYLTEDFKIEYVHNVTETRTNPQTGQPETIIVRQQSSFWTPFAGALAGQALGSLLFRPQYYVPPVYQSGMMTGYGGYGSSYSQAVNQYQTRYQTAPPAVQNRQTFRSSGSINRSSGGSSTATYKTPTQTKTTTTTTPKTSTNTTKSTGSGVGSSTLKSTGNSTSVKRKSGFGSSSGKSRRSSGFGSRRR